MMKTSGVGTPIMYRRWRHRQLGYSIEVQSVDNYSGTEGSFSVVKVLGSNSSETRHMSWPIATFLATFEPLGRPMKNRNRWKHMLDP